MKIQMKAIALLCVCLATTNGYGQQKVYTNDNMPGASHVCSGTPVSQTPADVAAQLSKLSSVTVTQLTDSGTNSNTYADVPIFSSAAGVFAYNHSTPQQIAISNFSGGGVQSISGLQKGIESTVTTNGQDIYYEGQNPNGTADIYAVPISQTGTCKQVRLSKLNMTPIAPLGVIQVSPASHDSTTGKDVIAFSEGLIVHRITGSGASWSSLPDINLPDPENKQVFHRIRLNPAFPNILWWKRDAPNPNPNGVATDALYVANLDASPIVAYSVAGSGVGAGHPSWSTDGLQLGYLVNGAWTVANVLNDNGTFALHNGAFSISRIGPNGTGFGADYCTWSPDGTVYVCNAIGGLGDPVYLMSLDGSKTKVLSTTNSTGTVDAGVPKPVWLDMQHILFSSDATGHPQIYMITGFTTTFP